MKKLTLLLVFVVGTSCFAQTRLTAQTENKEIGILQFESELIDYGEITQNENGERFFIIKNVGKAPVTISRVKSSCGCSVATKPTGPILPNETEKIGIKYDTKRLGRFSKTIVVTSNAENGLVKLRITGNVTTKEL